VKGCAQNKGGGPESSSKTEILEYFNASVLLTKNKE